MRGITTLMTHVRAQVPTFVRALMPSGPRRHTSASPAIPLLVATCLLAGCAHSIHQVHTSDFVPYASIPSGDVVKGYSEQFVVLGFTDNTNYIDEAYERLIASCPRGAVTGITTQISTSLGFMSWTNKALMQGLCVEVSGVVR